MVRIRKRHSRAGMSNFTVKEGAAEQLKDAAKQAAEEAAKQAENEAAKQAAAEKAAKQAAAEEAVKQAAAEKAAKQAAAEEAAKQAGEEAAKQAAAEEAANQAAVEEAAKAKVDSVDDELENKLKQEVLDVTHAVKLKEIERRASIEVIALNRVRASLRKHKEDAVSRDSARAKRMAKLKRLAQKVLSTIRNHKHAWLFMEPVDAQAMGLWDYHEVIKKLMDLGTIQQRMDAKDGTGYKNVKEVCDDVRLVFSNAVTYNEVGSDAYIMAKVISGKFEEQWKAFVEPKMQEEELKWTLQLSESDALWVVLKTAERDATEKVEGNLSRMLENLDKQLEDLKQKATPPRKKMSMEEKTELRDSLGRLSGDNLKRVIQILAQTNSGINANTEEAFLCFNATNDEVQVNIYGLDSATLWRLHRYVQSITEFRARVMHEPESSPDDAAMTTLLSGKKRCRKVETPMT